MKRFSSSCLSTYENCSYSCKLEYGAMGDDKREDIEVNFYGEHGALLHDLFDSYYKSVKLPKENMEDTYFKEINKLKSEFPDGKKGEFIDSALKQIEWFYDKWADIEPIATEKEFDEFFIDNVPLHFKGFIDRIDGSIENKSVTLSDYKTGSSSKFTKKELQDNVQATLYSLWFYKEYGFYPDRFVFIFTKERKIKEIVINDAFIKRGLARINRITQNIENGIFIPEAKGGVFFCKKFCNYYRECPKFNPPKEEGGGWNIV